jgi:putative DNA primase/helicase
MTNGPHGGTARSETDHVTESRVPDGTDNNAVGDVWERRVDENGHELAEPHTDLGNARRLVAAYGHRIRHVPAWKRWYVWDGSRWAHDQTGQVIRYAKTVARRMLVDAESLADDDRRKRPLTAAAKRAESAGGLRSMVELAGTEPGVALATTDLDGHPHLLNTASGVLNLDTLRLTAHDPRLHMTKIAAAGYDPAATCPEFDAFLARVQPDGDVRDYLARLLGQSMTGRVEEHLLAILYGPGANGKTTLTEAVQTVLGDYAAAAEPGLLIDRGDVHPTGVADLFGLRLAVTHETDAGRRLAEGTVKRLTGGDTIKARRMREDFWQFTPTHSIVMHTNHRPVVSGTDEGIWRRIRLVPFDVVIPVDERDGKLPEKLAAERDGILAWLVRGLADWRARGLAEPGAVVKATDAYRADSDTLARFIAEKCLTGPHWYCHSSDLFAAWQRWCAAENVEAGTHTAFSTAVEARGFDKHKSHGRQKWTGIALSAEGQ